MEANEYSKFCDNFGDLANWRRLLLQIYKTVNVREFRNFYLQINLSAHISGDLFYSDSDAMDSKEWDLDAWDKVTGQYNRRRVICAVDWIVPGHGKMFKYSFSSQIAFH